MEKLLNTLSVQVIKIIIIKNKFLNKIIESVAILIFIILKFRNIGRSTFDRYKFCTPPVQNSKLETQNQKTKIQNAINNSKFKSTIKN